MPVKLLSAIVLTYYLFFHLSVSAFAAEENTESSLSGSLGAEVWYAGWYAQGGLEALGIKLDYEINPSALWGYSSTFAYRQNDNIITSLILDYFTTELEEGIQTQTDTLDKSETDLYRYIRGGFTQRLFGTNYLHLSMMQSTFNGMLTLNKGGETFGNVDGTRWLVNSRWTKADVLLLSDLGGNAVSGFGYRYLSYRKPLAFIDFQGTEQEDESCINVIQADTVLSGRIDDTTIKGHSLVIGVWDKSYIGMPTYGRYFLDCLFYIGSVDVESRQDIMKGKIAMGAEGSFGGKLVYRFTRRAGLSMRLGFRVLYNRVAIAEKTGQDRRRDIWTGIQALDMWYGPFFAANLYF